MRPSFIIGYREGEEWFVATLEQNPAVGSEAFLWRFKVAKEVFVVVVAVVGAVALAAFFAEALDTKVVVVFTGEPTAPGTAFQQALGKGYTGGDTMG